MHHEIRDRARGLVILGLLMRGLWLALAHSPAAAQAPAGPPAVRVENAWIRWLPAGVPAGGYLTLINTGDQALTLIGASSPAYGEVMLHHMQNRAGSMQMMPAQRITVEAHATLDFAKAGYHLMLMHEMKPLHAGDQVPITLRFADGASLTVSFEVRQ